MASSVIEHVYVVEAEVSFDGRFAALPLNPAREVVVGQTIAPRFDLIVQCSPLALVVGPGARSICVWLTYTDLIDSGVVAPLAGKPDAMVPKNMV